MISRRTNRPGSPQGPIQPLFGIAALLVVAGLALGCSPSPPPVESISNDQLDVVISNLSDAWTVETNQGDSLVLRSSDPERQGTIEFVLGPEDEGVNLIAAMDLHRQDIEIRPDGVYAGGRELTGPTGSAFYSRGRFNDGDTPLEETRILGIHPRSNRLLQLVYTYPAADDSSIRVGELIEVFAEVE